MNIKIEEISQCCKKLIVEVPSEKVNTVFNQVLDTYHKNAKIDGFRKGTAPRELIYNHFSKDIKDDVLWDIIHDTYSDVIKESQVKPILVLNVSGTPERGKPLKYEMTLEIVPKIKLPKYKGISLKKPEDIVITDEIVDKAIEKLLSDNGNYATSNHEAIEENDVAIIDYEGKIDGKPIGSIFPNLKDSFLEKGNNVETYKIAEYLNFYEQIKGMHLNEERDVQISFPNDYPAKPLAGKNITYHVKINAILSWQPMTIDEYLKFNENCKTVEELKARLKADIEKEEENKRRQALIGEIQKYLLEKTEIEVPPSLITEEIERIASHMALEAFIYRIANFNKEEFVNANYDKLMEIATKWIKTEFIIYEISRKHRSNR